MSFSNPQHATYIASLIVDMFAADLCSTLPTETGPGQRARILVMAPYRAQVSRLNTAIRRLSKLEYVQSLVEVRTVDTAMGDTADIAILDLTRSNEVGFTNQLELLNVGVTRSRFGLVIVVNSSVARSRKGPNLNKIWKYCEQRGAVLTLYDHMIPDGCQECHGPAHKSGKRCKKPQKCLNCRLEHHTRNCRTHTNRQMSDELAFQEFPGFKTLAALQVSDASNTPAQRTIDDDETLFHQGFEVADDSPKSGDVTPGTTQVDSSDSAKVDVIEGVTDSETPVERF